MRDGADWRRGCSRLKLRLDGATPRATVGMLPVLDGAILPLAAESASLDRAFPGRDFASVAFVVDDATGIGLGHVPHDRLGREQTGDEFAHVVGRLCLAIA